MKKHLFGIIFCLVLLFAITASASVYNICGDFEYVILDDGTAKIMDYYGSDTDLVIPETLDGHTVSALYEHIDNSESFKQITSISIPNTLTTIEPEAFGFCYKLTDIKIAKDHPTLAFIDGVLYNKERKSVLCYLQTNTAEHFDIPDGIKLIESEAFFRTKLVSVNIPGSVEQIDRTGFYQSMKLEEIHFSEGLRIIDRSGIYNCTGLKSVSLPASVTEIGESNFASCDNLTEIQVSSDNPVFIVVDGVLINQKDGLAIVFPRNSPIETCEIPEGVTRIGNQAFEMNRNVKKVILPESLNEIGISAFYACTQLNEINLPDSITKIERNALDSCYKLTSLHIPAGLTEINNNFTSLGIIELIIPNTVTSIEDSFGFLDITEVVIPDSVTKLGNHSFTHCHNLSSITIPASVTKMGEPQYMFKECPDDLVIKVEPGSYAEQYCKDNNFRYECIEEAQAPAEDEDPFDWLKSE